MNNNKDCNIEYLVDKISLLKKKNQIIGFTNGCFDLLHNGHLVLLSEAKKRCDYLIVGLNSDSSIRLIKGNGRPVDEEKVRVSKLSEQKDVNAIVVFAEENPLELIKKITPHILFKGSDYSKREIIGKDFIIEKGGKVLLIDILEGYSTTNIINNSIN